MLAARECDLPESQRCEQQTHERARAAPSGSRVCGMPQSMYVHDYTRHYNTSVSNKQRKRHTEDCKSSTHRVTALVMVAKVRKDRRESTHGTKMFGYVMTLSDRFESIESDVRCYLCVDLVSFAFSLRVCACAARALQTCSHRRRNSCHYRHA